MKNFKTRALIFTPMDLLSKSLTKRKTTPMVWFFENVS
jgi:hypothetical protein